MINAIIPECYVDTCLINILLDTGTDSVNHGKGNSSVAKKMTDKFRDAFAVGIIDRDKRKIDYINEFHLHNETLKEKLLLYKHPDKHHYIIQLCPESETWICNVSKDLGIDMERSFGLPATPIKLARLSKNIDVTKDDKFVKLFKEIKVKAIEVNYKPVIKLIYWLKYLKENTYKVDVSNLAN